MKLFHLADLHIGKIIKKHSLIEDQQYILNQILMLAYQEQPDAVLIAGDVYDKTVPSVYAVTVFDDFLTSLSKEGIAVFIISGNHDSPERLSFACRIMEKSNIYVSGSFAGTLKEVVLNDQYGEVHFHLFPFIRPAMVKNLYKQLEIDSYQAAVNAVLNANPPDEHNRNILIAHQFVTAQGESLLRCESETEPVGGINQIDASLFTSYDYTALGHLHGSQKIGRETIRYAGSPLKYSFSECNQKKSVTVVELKEKEVISINQISLVPLRDMRKIKGPLEKLIDEQIVREQNNEDYLQITLTDEGEIIDAMIRLRFCYPNILELNFERQKVEGDLMSNSFQPGEEKTPYELFENFFYEQNGVRLNSIQERIVKMKMKSQEGM